jgi:hypothetical protein
MQYQVGGSPGRGPLLGEKPSRVVRVILLGGSCGTRSLSNVAARWQVGSYFGDVLCGEYSSANCFCKSSSW